MRRLLISVLFGFIYAGVTSAQGLSVQLGSASARFFFSTEMWGQQAGPLDLEVGAMYKNNGDYMLSAGLLVRNDNLDSPVIISVGTRAYYADTSTPTKLYQVMALSIGGELLYIPDSWNGVGVGFHYFTAPNVVSFLDAETLSEYGARLDYQLTPQASIFLGYDNVSFAAKSTGVSVTVASEAYIGVGMRF